LKIWPPDYKTFIKPLSRNLEIFIGQFKFCASFWPIKCVISKFKLKILLYYLTSGPRSSRKSKITYLCVTGDIYPIKTYADILWKWKNTPFNINAVSIVISNVCLAYGKSIIKKQAGIWTMTDEMLVKNCNSAGLK
jgi:hypothetical protein